jgi:LmbE family N-acetylglucosaminyl deacetylase
MTSNGNNAEPDIKKVLGIFAHPDDPEYFAGATFARWAAEGAEVTFVLATSGDKGSEDPEITSEQLQVIREEEERKAAAALGVKEVVFLRHPDGMLQATLELRRELSRMIRLKQPDVVVTSDPTMWYRERYVNHPDHRAIGEAALAAVFPASRDRLTFVELERDEGLQPHKVDYLYIAGAVNPTKIVDVTDYIETKIDSLREHKSQIKDIEATATRIREWTLDPDAPDDAPPRHIERFHVIKFS